GMILRMNIKFARCCQRGEQAQGAHGDAESLSMVRWRLAITNRNSLDPHKSFEARFRRHVMPLGGLGDRLRFPREFAMQLRAGSKPILVPFILLISRPEGYILDAVVL